MKTRILVVTAFFPSHGGGVEAVAGQLASRLDGAHFTITWMAGARRGQGLPAESETLAIEPVPYFDPLERRSGLPCPLWGPRAIIRLLRKVRHADVVHLHDVLYMPCIAAMAFARLLRRPVVITQHIGELPLRSRFTRWLLDALYASIGRWMLVSAEQTVFVAEPVKRFFESFVRFRRPARLVANGVDHQRYHPCASRRQGSFTRILYVGRFVEKKGIQLLERCTDIPATYWNFVGWGPLSPASWQTRPDNVTLHGHLQPGAIVPLYQEADLLVLPSIGEGFPLVVQEALACGTPVLVSSETADTCPARDRRCVFEVEVQGSDASDNLRQALMELVASPGILQAARQHAVRLASQWSWEACASHYMGIYRDLASHRRAYT